jgi:AbrB family looped-hinge helix DNA binding protein
MSFHKHIHLVGTATLGPKGQVVIPAEVREAMDIHPGDKLVALYFDEKKSIAFITEREAQEHIIKMGEQFTQFKDTLQKESE